MLGLTVTVMFGFELSKPLRLATSRATLRAVVMSGSHTTPARAAASAAFWMSEARLYQAPTSTARPTMSRSGTRSSPNRAIT